MPVNENIGKAIKRLREERGMLQSELAKKIGVSNKAVSSWESGRTEPNLNMIKQICNVFGVTYNTLLDCGNAWENHMKEIKADFEGKDGYYINPETAQAAQEIFENKELRLLFDAARDASPEDLMTAYNVILALKKKEQGN